MKMDWAEELKMSIRKTTARKGRRSKSRDVLKDLSQKATSSTSHSKGQLAGSNNTELSIDITLDMPSQENQNLQSASAANNISSSLTSGDNISNVLNSSSEPKRPSALRRISGGWADSVVGSKFKSKKASIEDDRFGAKKSPKNSPIDDIPTIPDLDDNKDDVLMNKLGETPSLHLNRQDTLDELNADLLAQNAFSILEDVNLSILTKCLLPAESLDEADEVWDWEKVFTDVLAEINSEKSLGNRIKNLELKPDELHKPND